MISRWAVAVFLAATLTACSPTSAAPTSAVNACRAVLRVNEDVSPGLSVNFDYAAEQARLAAAEDDRFSHLADLVAQVQDEGATEQRLAAGQSECRELGLNQAIGPTAP